MNQELENNSIEEPQERTSSTSFLEGLTKLNRDKLIAYLPMVSLAFLLTVFYISNIHYSVKTLKETEEIKQDVKELQAEYISIQNDLMYRSKQSEVAERLKSTGVKELRTRPYKIDSEKK